MEEKTVQANPRTDALLQHAWRIGALGHRLSELLINGKSIRLLESWVEVHGGVIIRTLKDEGDYPIGFHACFCPECELRAVAFVIESKCSLLARAAGDFSYHY